MSYLLIRSHAGRLHLFRTIAFLSLDHADRRDVIFVLVQY